MKTRTFSRAVSFFLCVAMCFSLLPMAAFAVETDAFNAAQPNGYYKVISNKEYALADGAVETDLVLNNASGTDRKAVHIIEVDTTNENVDVLPGYYQIDKLNPENLAGDSAIWQAKELTKTVDYYEKTLGYEVVGAMNTALAYDSNAPYGYMVWDGVVYGTPEVHKGAQTYLAINYDGTCELRSMSEPLTGNEKTAISANFGWLVKDGKLTSTSVERTSSDASRSMLGIKADGTLVICHVDGRAGAYSSGLSNYEMGELMLALGCVNAVNGDGGGSSTFISQRPGETGNTMRSKPSDGAERPTINSIIVVNKAVPSGEFASAALNADYDYIAPGATMTFTADGIDTNNYPMDVPAGVTWAASAGSIDAAGNYTAGSATGDVTIQMIYEGEVVGEKIIHVVNPDMFGFADESTVLPYGKSAALNVVATYGADDWAVCLDGAYTLALDNSAAATLNGNILTAATDESIAGVNVTATYLPDPTKNDTLVVSYGKGSEIIFDFEDGENGDAGLFLGVDEMYDWAAEVGATAPIQGDGNYSENTDSHTFLATTSNDGQVKHGTGALGVTLDYTDATFASWSYNMFFYTGEPIVLRDVANGKNATAFGAWVYIPEGAAGLAMQLGVYTKGASGTLGFTQLNFQVTTLSGAKKNLNAITEADIPESRWVYASADLTGSDYYSLADPMGKLSREPSFMRYYVKPTVPANLTFYFDDFTLDYSSAVDDRVLPTVSNVSYATADTAVEMTDGVTINGNKVTFSANVADNIGLQASTGVISVDGKALNTSVSGGVMSAEEVTLSSGKHRVSFEIQDTLGNLAKVTRTFTIVGDAAVTLTGHNDSGKPAEYDSVYYVDINVADIDSVEKLAATLKLQTANTWELEGMTVAPGFKATASLDEATGSLATITVERVGSGVAAVTEGETTLVSIPVRVWSWNGVNHVTDEAITPEAQFKTGYCPIVSIGCEVVKGLVNGENPFGGELSVETNLNDNVNPWHYHDAELTVLNQDPGCQTSGYQNRTYCETCQSVIDWGTEVDPVGHVYAVAGDQLVCECGDTITGTGLVTVNGKIYCLIADKLVTGWQNVDNKWVYAAASTKQVQTGTFGVSGLSYTADENGFVVKGAWVTDENGTKYSYGPQFYTREWADIDGAKYYFGTDSYVYTGIQYIPVNRNNMKEGIIWYEFAEDGKFIEKLNGVAERGGKMYYVVDGLETYGGLMYADLDGDGESNYYYARTSGELVANRSYTITKTNDLLPVDTYTFDAEGKMVNPPVVDPNPDPGPGTNPDPDVPEVKNGICDDGSGKLFWYVDGVKTYGGLMLIDGNYYYARTSGEIVVNRSYWPTKTNDLLPAAQYTFDAEGKMVNPPVVDPNPDPDPGTNPDPDVPEVKNGICDDGSGKLFWYVDGVKTYGGLMLIDGNYYYARTSGEIVVNRSYWPTKTNDLLPVAQYTFDAEGKMVNPPEIDIPEENPDDPDVPEEKNGICADESGKLFWYVDGVKTYGGLMLIDGYYYYARTSGEIVVDRSYWPTKTNNLLPVAKYIFDSEGKMLNPPAI